MMEFIGGPLDGECRVLHESPLELRIAFHGKHRKTKQGFLYHAVYVATDTYNGACRRYVFERFE